jgi:hypothetical protein
MLAPGINIRHVAELADRAPHEECYDAHSPFGYLRHAGKLVLPADLRDKYLQDFPPPKNHCVVYLGTGSALGVLRFYPFTLNDYRVNKALGAPERIIDIHKRHLQKLAEFGLRPWIRDMALGSHPSAPGGGGLYILQDVLPPNAEVGLSSWEDRLAMTLSVSQYQGWAHENKEPACMVDIQGEDQASKVGSTIYLHDVEPDYTTNKP